MPENVEAKENLRLVSRAMAGSEAALAALYDRYADPLFAFIHHHLDAPRADVEDVFQETWLAALRSLQSYRGKTRIFFWLCGIARHKIADRSFHLRKERFQGAPLIKGEALAGLVEEGPLPDGLLAQIETRSLVVEALALLPAEYRSALLARYVEECGVPEIARRLGRTYKATESLLSRARSSLRETLTHTREVE
jgi:RNA polymerase sigma-70 factor (ECF subfamily)